MKVPTVINSTDMISIITPVLNEEKNIRVLLSHLGSLEGDFEIVIVDGRSSDRTMEEVKICMKSFTRELKIMEAKRGRALQMNKGAEAAKGDIFLFLHADCSLEKDALILIEKAIYNENAVGGGFRQAYSSPDMFLRLGSLIGNLRVSLTGIFYGDYGIFMRKDIFGKIGGFDDIPFLEDVELCRKAKRHGKLIHIDRRIITSPKRYLEKGKLKLATVFLLANFFNMFRWRPMFLWKYIADR